MLESIRTLIDTPATNDLLVKCEDRVAARHRRRLQQQAHERAKDCVAQAQAEAEVVRAHAFKEGYAQGMLQVAGDLSLILLQARKLATTLQAQLEASARQLLGDVLMDDQLLDGLLQRLHMRHAGAVEPVLQLVLPQRCRPQEAALKATLSNSGVERFDIGFHAQERYLIRQADQVIELDIHATEERLTPRLLAQLECLPDSVRELDDASMQLIIGWANRLASATPGAASAQKEPLADEH